MGSGPCYVGGLQQCYDYGLIRIPSQGSILGEHEIDTLDMGPGHVDTFFLIDPFSASSGSLWHI